MYQECILYSVAKKAIDKIHLLIYDWRGIPRMALFTVDGIKVGAVCDTIAADPQFD
jgi:hypothetical protein